MKYYALSLFAICLVPHAVNAQSVTPLLETALACVDEPDRLDRLYCYDEALGRIVVEDVPKEKPTAVPALPEELRKFGAILASADQTETGVPILVRNSITQKYVFEPGKSAIEMLREKASSEDFKDFVHSTDVSIAVAADGLLGSDGGLIISCESDITNVRFVWDTPVADKFTRIRIQTGASINDSGRSFELTLRASPKRHFLNAPRGLEAINLLRQMQGTPIAQVSIGEADDLRSLFFDMKPLAEAIPYVGQHCGWTQVQSKETE